MNSVATQCLEIILTKEERLLLEGQYELERNFFFQAFTSVTSNRLHIIRLNEQTPEYMIDIAREGIQEYLLDKIGVEIQAITQKRTFLDEYFKETGMSICENRKLNHEIFSLNDSLTNSLRKKAEGHWLIITNSDMCDTHMHTGRIPGGEVSTNRHYGIVHDRTLLKGRYKNRVITKMSGVQKEEYYKKVCAHEAAHLLFNMKDMDSSEHEEYFGLKEHECLSTSEFVENAEYCQSCIRAFNIYQKAKILKQDLGLGKLYLSGDDIGTVFSR